MGHQVSISQDVFCAMYKEASRVHQERGLPSPRYEASVEWGESIMLRLAGTREVGTRRVGHPSRVLMATEVWTEHEHFEERLGTVCPRSQGKAAGKTSRAVLRPVVGFHMIVCSMT